MTEKKKGTSGGGNPQTRGGETGKEKKTKTAKLLKWGNLSLHVKENGGAKWGETSGDCCLLVIGHLIWLKKMAHRS